MMAGWVWYMEVLLLLQTVFGELQDIPSETLLYPYGESEGDFTLPDSANGVTAKLSLPEPFLFFNQSFTDLYVNKNGVLSLGTLLTSHEQEPFPSDDGPLIAPFMADARQGEQEGTVYFRYTANPALLDRGSADISDGFLWNGYSEFSPTWMIVATWHQVAQQRNTFQAVLTTDGDSTFVMFNYLNVTWPGDVTPEGEIDVSVDDAEEKAEVGLNAGDGVRFFALPSGTSDVTMLTSSSNVDTPGRWLMRTDTVRVRSAGCEEKRGRCRAHQKYDKISRTCLDETPEALCPTFEGPYMSKSDVRFKCVVKVPRSSAEARYRVSFLFDGEEDEDLASTTLGDDGGEVILDQHQLRSRLNKHISCSVRTFWTSNRDVMSGVYRSKTSYWAGIRATRIPVHIEEADLIGQSFQLFSTIPMICGDEQKSCELQTEYTAAPFIMARQNGVSTNISHQIAESGRLRFVFNSGGWDSGSKRGLDAARPLVVKAVHGPFMYQPSVASLSFQPLNMPGTLWHNYRIPDVKVQVQDSEGALCMVTGDTHVTTFDNKAHRLGEIGQFRLWYSKVHSEFEAHIRIWPCKNWTTSCVCGLIVREGNVVLGADMCQGSRASHLKFIKNSPGNLPDGASITNDKAGRFISVNMPSGRYIKANIYEWGMNIYAFAMNFDREHTAGLCGEFNGDPMDDLDVPTRGDIPVSFVEYNRISARQSLFERQPGRTTKIPPSTKYCVFSWISGATCGQSHVVSSEEYLGVPGIAVTEASMTPSSQYLYTFIYSYDTPGGPGGVRTWPTRGGMRKNEVISHCSVTIRASSVYKVCSQFVQNFSAKQVTENCIINIQGSDDLNWAAASVDELRQQCLMQLYNKGATRKRATTQAEWRTLLQKEPVTTLINNMCPNDCHGNGACRQGTCICSPGFFGRDCSLTLEKGPDVLSVSPSVCSADSGDCPSFLTLTVDTLAPSATAFCRVTYAKKVKVRPRLSEYSEDDAKQRVVATSVVGHKQLRCPIPPLNTWITPKTTGRLHAYKVELSYDQAKYGRHGYLRITCNQCRKDAVCLPACSRHGRCRDGVCVCDEGHGGADCSSQIGPLSITDINPSSCVIEDRDCTSTYTLNVPRVQKTSNVYCSATFVKITKVVGSTMFYEPVQPEASSITMGTIVSETSVSCTMPLVLDWINMIHDGKQYGVQMRLSLDGESYGNHMIYQINCNVCSQETDSTPLPLVQCVNDCSGHGECIAPRTCLCDSGYRGDYCSVQIGKPPGIVEIVTPHSTIYNYTNTLLVHATNFDVREPLMCLMRYVQPTADGHGFVTTRSVRYRAQMRSRRHIVCPLPNIDWWYTPDATSGELHKYTLELSADNETYSDRVYYSIRCPPCDRLEPCLNDCSNRGRCVVGRKCKCYAGWGGADCSVRSRNPITIVDMKPPSCTIEEGNCPWDRNITLDVFNIYPDDCVTCKITYVKRQPDSNETYAIPAVSVLDTVTIGHVTESRDVICPIPNIRDWVPLPLYGRYHGYHITIHVAKWKSNSKVFEIECRSCASVPVSTTPKPREPSCKNNCNNRGVCRWPDICMCNRGYRGDDCSVEIGKPPQLVRILTDPCTVDEHDCPTSLEMEVRNVDIEDTVYCETEYMKAMGMSGSWVSVKSVVTKARVLDDGMLRCPVPASTWWYSDATNGRSHSYAVRLTRDNSTYSLKFFYQILCLHCQEDRPTSPPPPTCENDCSGHGTCRAPGICRCDEGYRASDCSVEIGKPPNLIGIFTDSCTADEHDCPISIKLQVSNVDIGDTMFCEVTYVKATREFGWVPGKKVVTEATVVDRSQVYCPVPASTWWYSGDTTGGSHGYRIRLSRDRSTWSLVLDYRMYCKNCPEDKPPTTPAPVCENDCSGRGTCRHPGICHCDAGYHGSVCSVETGKPPELVFILTKNCTIDEHNCPTQLDMKVRNVDSRDSVYCEVKYVKSAGDDAYHWISQQTVVTRCTVLDRTTLRCPVPATTWWYSGATSGSYHAYSLRLTRNNATYSQRAYYPMFCMDCPEEKPPTTPAPKCENDCSGHGTCQHNGICDCAEGYRGGDCSVNTLKPPHIDAITTPTCFVRRHRCSTVLDLRVTNIYRKDKVFCRVTYANKPGRSPWNITRLQTVTEAKVTSSSTVQCSVPQVTWWYSGDTYGLMHGYSISITTDSDKFKYSNNYIYVMKCVSCPRQQPTTPAPQCELDCSGHGICMPGGVCLCQEGYRGEVCSVVASQPPRIVEVLHDSCSIEADDCPYQPGLPIKVHNIDINDQIYCRISYVKKVGGTNSKKVYDRWASHQVITMAQVTSRTRVICPMPDMDDWMPKPLYGKDHGYHIDISVDKVTYSNYILYDIRCNSCLESAPTTAPLPICPHNCYGNGECIEGGVCICYNGWRGVLCNIMEDTPPVITGIKTAYCNIDPDSNCTTEVMLGATNYEVTDDMTCSVTYMYKEPESSEWISTDLEQYYPAVILGESEVICPVPPVYTWYTEYTVYKTHGYAVSISVDNQTYSDPEVYVMKCRTCPDEQPSCMYDCHGRGICRHPGHCECDVGFAGSSCKTNLSEPILIELVNESSWDINTTWYNDILLSTTNTDPADPVHCQVTYLKYTDDSLSEDGHPLMVDTDKFEGRRGDSLDDVWCPLPAYSSWWTPGEEATYQAYRITITQDGDNYSNHANLNISCSVCPSSQGIIGEAKFQNATCAQGDDCDKAAGLFGVWITLGLLFLILLIMLLILCLLRRRDKKEEEEEGTNQQQETEMTKGGESKTQPVRKVAPSVKGAPVAKGQLIAEEPAVTKTPPPPMATKGGVKH